MNKLVIKGAREHNLQNIDVSFPRDKLIVVTGLSGSGKSSLAFDTIYAEGQRRYVESLSSYARQFLGQMEKPDVDSIEGLSPAISIEQKTTHRNPRSTVGTVTEVYDYLRLLYARIGVQHCHRCGKPISRQTVDEIVTAIMNFPAGSRLMILAPVVSGRKGEYRKEFEYYRKEGFVRVRVNGEILPLDKPIALDRKKKHNIEVVVDRIVLKEGVRRRLADSLETALNIGEGSVMIDRDGEDVRFSANYACTDCGISFGELQPRMFSFNAPQGACPECDGLGYKMRFDPDLFVDDPNLSIRDGALKVYNNPNGYYMQRMEGVADHYGFSLDTPFKQLTKKQRDILFFGTGKTKVDFAYESERFSVRDTRSFEGIINNFSRRYRETASESMRAEMDHFMANEVCSACQGKRLRPEMLAVYINGTNIIDLTDLSVHRALAFFRSLALPPTQQTIAEMILKEIEERLGFLANVGVGYLTLSRSAGTLSGGEAQRIRLATQIGSSLMGVLYVLDEPSIGLHQRDNDKLLATLRRLRDLGNTLIIVEHDEQTILQADHVLDLGPGAGANGGRITAQGTPAQIKRSRSSLTGQYLTGKRTIAVPRQRREGNGRRLMVKGASANNLKSVDVSLPLGCLIAVTGVSGSGKSTLINTTVYQHLHNRLYRTKRRAGKVTSLKGAEHIDKIIAITQDPIGRTPRSNPSTYIDAFTPIRDLFAALPESKARGYKAGRFSFNVSGGRCEACGGDGTKRIEMHFLPDIFVTCEVCKGKRYNRETLDITYKGKTISQVLDMTVSEGLRFFEKVPRIRKKLDMLEKVGLGYIHLGQPSTTLSGGEAQRIKLAKELSKRGTGSTIYVLDEPTTGLHFADIQKLLDVLNALVDRGNTVVVIEHNLDVIKTADRIIDLGPEGGEDGGQVVAVGTPEEVAAADASYTGQYLRAVISAAGQSAAG